MPRQPVERLIADAQAGDAEALGRLLENYRDHLRQIARQKLDSAIKGRVDPSDVVQQTFLEAKQAFDDFRGQAGPQFFAWIERILENNVANTVQFHRRSQKRSVLRERHVENGASRQHDGDLFDGKGASPSHKIRQSEQREIVIRFVDRLPTGEQEAIRLRYLKDHSLDEIAVELARSKQAVAGLLKRGLRRLREQLAIEFKDSSS